MLGYHVEDGKYSDSSGQLILDTISASLTNSAVERKIWDV